jgi:pimeloyl-ACP methyl ester carboxylesterase
MPSGHTVADMAADHARFIHEQLGGRVDVVLGVSYGGIIALYLAANHPEVVRHVVIVAAAATISERGKELDLRWARLRAEGRYAEAGAAMLEYVMPGPRFGGLRRLAGRAVGPVLAKIRTPAADLLVEGEAEFAYDARDVLGRITVPVLLVCGDADLFFPRAAVEETAAGIPDSSLVLYPGLGHARTAANRRVPRDVLDWLARREAVARDRG